MVLPVCDCRYLVRHTDEIDPDPQPDAHHIAERVAGVAGRAYQTGQPQCVLLKLRSAASFSTRYSTQCSLLPLRT
jgi:hypothetical protein